MYFFFFKENLYWKILAHVHFRLLISAFIYGTSASVAIAIFSTMFLLIQNNSLEQSNKLDLLNETPNGFSNKQMVWVVEKVAHL